MTNLMAYDIAIEGNEIDMLSRVNLVEKFEHIVSKFTWTITSESAKHGNLSWRQSVCCYFQILKRRTRNIESIHAVFLICVGWAVFQVHMKIREDSNVQIALGKDRGDQQS